MTAEDETSAAIAKVRSKTLNSGLDDWVAIDWIEGWAKHAGEDPGVLTNEVVLGALDELVNGGLVELGSVTETTGYQPWEGSPATVLSRLRREVSTKDPGHYGYFCWTRNTAAGHATALSQPWHWEWTGTGWRAASNGAVTHPNPGIELDWLAIDADDRVALFSTGGAGPMPLAVVDRLEEVGTAIERLASLPILGECAESPSTDGGRLHFETWTGPCLRGLFAYDWAPGSAGPYVRLVVPSRPIRADQLADELIRNGAALARLPLRFAEATSIAARDLELELWNGARRRA